MKKPGREQIRGQDIFYSADVMSIGGSFNLSGFVLVLLDESVNKLKEHEKARQNEVCLDDSLISSWGKDGEMAICRCF